MSSLFSYELDEKQIRSTLQKAELPYDDSYWFDFENSFSERQVAKTSSGPAFIKFNLNINRNVLLPAFFIIALAGVSAIMFKFVDLKPGKNVPEQKALIPNADNYKIEKKVVATPPKKEIPQQAVQATAKKDTIIVPTTTVTQTVITPTLIQEQTIAKNTSAMPMQKPDTSSVNSGVQAVQNNSIVPTHKKRRRNKTSEQIDVIKAPIILSSNSTPEIEPELKIK